MGHCSVDGTSKMDNRRIIMTHVYLSVNNNILWHIRKFYCNLIFSILIH